MEKIKLIYINTLYFPYYVLYYFPIRLYKAFRNVLSMAKFSYLSENHTIYHNEKRKKRYVIFYELIKWYISYNEVNYRYYLYGLDREEYDNIHQYMGHRRYKELRDTKNYNPQIEEGSYNYICLIKDKFLFSKYLSSVKIPVVKDWAIFNKEKIRWLDSGQSFDSDIFFKESDKNLDCFCKKLDGEKGKDIFSLKLRGNELFINNNKVTCSEFLNRISGNYILQERLIQHHILNKLYPYSINTLRIVTMYNNGNVKLFSGVLRVGTDGNHVDNFSAGGLVVGIDLYNGELMNEGIHNKKKPKVVKTHPDTGLKFSGYVIPCFHETVELVKNAHAWFYGLHSIGWDVAITEKGPVLIEGNDNWGGDIVMLFKKDFKKEFLRLHLQNEYDFIVI